MKNFLYGVVFAVIVMLAGGIWLLRSGRFDFRADQPVTFLERKLAMTAVDASTERHAPDVKDPVSPTEENLVAGAKLYLNHCAGCHGVPANRESQFSRSFYPPPPGFFQVEPDMPENQNFYIIAHGIRWTGMPAWSQTLSDAQIWQLVTFLNNIQKLPPSALNVFESPVQSVP